MTIQKLDITGFHGTRIGGNTKFVAPCVYQSAFSLPSKKRNVAGQGNGSVSSAENGKVYEIYILPYIMVTLIFPSFSFPISLNKFMCFLILYELWLLQETPSNVPQRSGLLVFFCVPVAPGKSRLIYTFPRNFSVLIGRITPRWVNHLQQNLVLDSDLYLLHIEVITSN